MVVKTKMKCINIRHIAVILLFAFGITVSSFANVMHANESELNSNKVLNVSHDNSEVKFSGEHASMVFEGLFETWEATLILPPSTTPKIEAIFDLTSAKTGDFTYDSTLPEGDWFDAENHPEGRFVSTLVKEKDGHYLVEGELTLKAITNEQNFTLYKTGEGLKAEFVIDRLEYDIGVESDPDAEWVSREIKMTLILNK